VLALVLGAVSPLAASPGPVLRGGTPTGQHDERLEAEIDTRVHRALEFVYRSQLALALREVDHLRDVAPRDPRVHLLEARLLRESFPDQSRDRDGLGQLAAPIHAALRRTIALSDSLLRVDERSLPGYLYRGWANMFRAQMHTLCNEYWSAGRTAKQGKEDLDRALLLDPTNADAKGVLGTYLYFADVLPRVVKIARAVVRVPGGDRQRGFDLLRESAAGTGYNRLDARALLGVIAFAFEGDYESGSAAFESLLADYPENPRLLEPLAAMGLLRPERMDTERLGRVAATYATHPHDWYRQLSQRLSFYQALAEIVLGHVDDARLRLEEVQRSGPTLPDWFPGDVALSLAETHLLVGAGGTARELEGRVAARPQVAARLRFVRDAAAAAPAAEAAAFRRAQEVARLLYDGDSEAASRLLAELPADSPAALFYRGEWQRMAGAPVPAMDAYSRITDAEWPARWRLYKMLAFSRLAEIEADQEGPRRAVATLERAIEYDSDPDLLRHLLRARRRHYDLVASGAVVGETTGGSTTAASSGQAP
jgi:tetratricopeptide (TPR) repeat protein